MKWDRKRKVKGRAESLAWLVGLCVCVCGWVCRFGFAFGFGVVSVFGVDWLDVHVRQYRQQRISATLCFACKALLDQLDLKSRQNVCTQKISTRIFKNCVFVW